MNNLWLSLGLQLVFFVVLLLEFIIPSAGILMAVSVAALAGSWWFVSQSTLPHLFSVVLIADFILIPVTIFVGFRLMQKSSLAHREGLGSDDGYQVQADLPKQFMGRIAITSSMLKPWGKVELDDQIYEATSTGEYLDSGIPVRVIDVAQNKLTVEPVSEGETI
jgi:membrane-bound ClpP family serine protease